MFSEIFLIRYSGGFDRDTRQGGNYAFGLSAAAAGYSVDKAIEKATEFNKSGTGRTLPKANENAIRQGYRDYLERRFPGVDYDAGAAYFNSTWLRDVPNVGKTVRGFINRDPRPTQRDVERYALEKWGTLDSPEAKAFMANFEQAFGAYPQHLDLDQAASLAGRRKHSHRQGRLAVRRTQWRSALL